MLQVTKIFRFEMAHAIHGYSGACQHIHGHSYELHVSVKSRNKEEGFLPSPGFIFDFKQLKQVVNNAIIHQLDHQLTLSKDYLNQHHFEQNFENLNAWEMEPTAENILLYIRNSLQKALPQNVRLHKLKIYETHDSYAEWEDQK